MHKRTAHRWRLLTVMMTGIFLALGSFWLAQMLEDQGAAINADAFKNEPDYIVEKFSFVRMTPDGQPRYLISGDKLVHRPIDDSADIDKPLVKSVVPGQPLMTIDAERARIDHGNTQVHLKGDVDVDRKGMGTVKPMKLETEALTIFPDEDRMTSPGEVLVTMERATIRGTGMQADNAAQTLRFERKGQIIYPPKNVR
jgi:lipopolysaccharide export system protein LptC